MLLFFVPVLYFSAYLYLYLLWSFRDNKRYGVTHAHTEYEVIFYQIRYSIHYHFEQWATAVYTLRNQYGAKLMIPFVACDDGGFASVPSP